MAAAPGGLLRRFYIAVLLVLSSNANAQNYGEIGEKCLTPNGQAGRCFSIYSCDAHKDILRERPLSLDRVRYLLKAHCGSWGQLPFLCCPIPGADQPPATVIKPFKTLGRRCEHSYHEEVGGGGDARPFTPLIDIRLGDQEGGGTTTPTSPAGDDGFGDQGVGGIDRPTAPASANPLCPPTTEDRLVSTGPDVVNHPNWSCLRNDICGADVNDRIFGGEEADLKEYPWLALLQYQLLPNGFHLRCGGAVISNRYVLTSAHCVTGLRGSMLETVRLGEHNTLTDPDCVYYKGGTRECGAPIQEFNVDEVIVHPLYRSNTTNKIHDIALIRLDRDADFTGNHVLPICLPNGDDVTKRYETESMFVAGWRWNEDSFRSNVKRWVKLPVVSNRECQLSHRGKLTIHGNQICAGGVRGMDACRGDIGGPLMHANLDQENRRVIYVATGVASLGGPECAAEGIPGVYTRIGPYMNWILDSLRL